MSRKSETVVVTGVNGQIGRAVACALQEQDYRVLGLDMVCEGCPVACIKADITSDESVAEGVEALREKTQGRIASLVHLAAYFDFTGEPNILYDKVNREGTRRLLEAMGDLEIEQIVYSGSSLVYAPTEPGMPIPEDGPLQAKWPYPRSKLETERVIREARGDVSCVLLRIGGLYTDTGGVPTLTHQIGRIYERAPESYLFAGDPSHGQAYVHLEDLVDAVVRTVRRRDELPDEAVINIAEAGAVSYQALQNRVGELVHGREWPSIRMPKPLARVGAAAKEKAESVIPDTLDQGEKPFIRPFMVDIADDHYELDIRRAEALLGWRPEHRLLDALPGMINALKEDPRCWYEQNGLRVPAWLEEADEADVPVEQLRERFESEYVEAHRRTSWAHWVNAGLGAWLLTSPATLGYQSQALAFSDVASGWLVLAFSLLSLSWRLRAARWGSALVGLWLLSAPLVFWAPTAASYLNDTVIGSLLIGFSVLVRPAPAGTMRGMQTGPEVPPGWDYSPSSWLQRLPIILLAVIGFLISRYLCAYQLGHIDGVWEPFFAGAAPGKNGTEEIITSRISHAWPVPDAGLGALAYMLEILTGMLGGARRWRTMPWVVLLFGILIVPLGSVSIFFIIIQPVLLGTWCTLCLIAAAAMLLQIPYSFDEILATCQFLARRRRAGRPLLRVLFAGDTDEGDEMVRRDVTERPPLESARIMLTRGLGVSRPLFASTAIGVWLMLTRITTGSDGSLADAEHLIGALVVTFSVAALAEVARSLRLLNVVLGVCLLATPFMASGGTVIGQWVTGLLAVVLIAVNLPRGRIEGSYGGWIERIV